MKILFLIFQIFLPSLFFLDEPDSGLDGIMARSLMEKLRDIANEDKIVMVISHAPDRTAELFDKIIVLAKSEKDNIGHLAFFGTVPEAFSFFETDSLEGVVKRINRKDENGDGLSDIYIEMIAKWALRAIYITANVNSMFLHNPNLESDYEYTIQNLIQQWIILLVFIVIYTIISIISLKFVDKDKR